MLLDPQQNAEIEVDVCLFLTANRHSAAAKPFVQALDTDSQTLLLELLADVEKSAGAILRSEPSDDADICWLAIPTVDAGQVKSIVVVRYCGALTQTAAMELWKLTDGRAELSLDSGCYGPMSHFREISQHVYFPIGVGLPGMTWKQRQPRMLSPLGSSPEFVRAANAVEAGLESGIGFPVLGRDGELASVLLLLASQEIPFAARFEIWIEETDGLVQQDVLNAPWPDGADTTWDGDALRETTEDLIYEAFEQRQAIVESLPSTVTESTVPTWRAIVLPVLAEKKSALVFWIR